MSRSVEFTSVRTARYLFWPAPDNPLRVEGAHGCVSAEQFKKRGAGLPQVNSAVPPALPPETTDEKRKKRLPPTLVLRKLTHSAQFLH